MESDRIKKLKEVHGEELCHICGLPCWQEGKDICSYPHARLPVEPIHADIPGGMWVWDMPEDK